MKEQVTEIVAAYVRKNRVDPSELPALINQVNQALASLGQALAEPAPLAPAVPIKRSVQAESISCLDCGLKSQMLKRHIRVAHGMTADEYRTRWSLPRDYPMVARNYSARRSELAKAVGLGMRGRSRKP
jgi:MucR family transcriptional regulator, transcriptional regulator of exopolysaccharide biosynthesis